MERYRHDFCVFEAVGSNPAPVTKKYAHFGYHRHFCRWYRAFQVFSPRISQVKQKIQTGVSQKLAGFEPPNSLEIYSALFETEFFKKGAIFISSKNQSAKGVNFSANRLKDWHLFLFRKRAPLKRLPRSPNRQTSTPPFPSEISTWFCAEMPKSLSLPWMDTVSFDVIVMSLPHQMCIPTASLRITVTSFP